MLNWTFIGSLSTRSAFWGVTLLYLLMHNVSLEAQDLRTVTVAGIKGESGFKDGPVEEAQFNNPHGLALDQNGNLYVADRFNHAIRKIDTSGNVTTLAGDGSLGDQLGNGNAARFFEPWHVACDSKQNVYVADSKNNKIKKIDAAGNVTLLAGTGNFGMTDSPNPLAASFGWPSGITYDYMNNGLYIAGHLTHVIRYMNLNTRQILTIAGIKDDFPDNFGSVDGSALQSRFYRPYGLHLNPDGTLVIADEWNSQIRMIDENNRVITLGGMAEVEGHVDGGKNEVLLNNPWDITKDASGNYYIMDGWNHVIRKIDQDTVYTTFAGISGMTGAADGPLLSATFNGATGIVYDSTSGKIYIADAFNHVIRSIQLYEALHLNSEGHVDCGQDSVVVSYSPSYYDYIDLYINDSLVKVANTSPIILPSSVLSPTNEVRAVGRLRNDDHWQLSDTLYITKSFGDIPQVLVDGPTTFCEGDSVVLTASYAGNVLWNNGTSNHTLTVTSSGDYFYEGNLNGCIDSSSKVSVTVLPAPDIQIDPSGNITIFPGEEIQVLASGAAEYTWSNDFSGTSVVLNEAGVYYVIGVDSNGCLGVSDSLIISIAALDIKVFNDTIYYSDLTDLAQSYDIVTNDSVTLDAEVVVLWPFDIASVVNNQFLVFNDPVDTVPDVIYYLSCLEDYEDICDTGIVYLIQEVDDQLNLTPPNAFSPNNDGINDYFEIPTLDAEFEAQITIFNRWGQVVFDDNNYNNKWDGVNYDGKVLPDGTYFYLLELPKNKSSYSGFVVIQK